MIFYTDTGARLGVQLYRGAGRWGCAACECPSFIIHLDLGKQMVPSGYKIVFYSALR